MRFTIDLEGLDAAVRDLNGYAERVRDLRPAFPEVRRAYTEHQRSWFATLGRGSWAALDERYARAKRRAGHTRGVLQRTGKLRDSLVDSPSVQQLRPNSLAIGTDDYRAVFHQAGRGVPQRRVLDIDAGLRAAVGRAIADHLRGRR